MRQMAQRAAITLIELLVVIAIMAVLIGLLLPAVQRVRDAASRTYCCNNLRQLGLASHQHHDAHHFLPKGVTSYSGEFPRMAWHVRLLPFLEQDNLWREIQHSYRQEASPFLNPPHSRITSIVPTFGCPSDSRVASPQFSHGYRISLTSYVGVNGTNLLSRDGAMFLDSRVRFAEVRDGLSNTLLAGERPPSADMYFGWWYAGVGQNGTGSGDMVLGVSELNLGGQYVWECGPGPYSFTNGRVGQQCDLFHYWSLHIGGAHYLYLDGSARFPSYGAASLLPALATIAGSEPSAAFD